MKTENIKTTKSITTGGSFGSLNVSYVPCGTIAWLKTESGEVHQAKLHKVWWEDGKVRCQWIVAGMTDTYVGSWCQIAVGNLYTTEHYAQHGKAGKYPSTGTVTPTAKFNMYERLSSKYGQFDLNFYLELHGTWSDILSVRTTRLNQDGTTEAWETPFCVTITERGVDVSIPMVDSGKRFLSIEAAHAAYKPKRVFTFDDDPERKTFTIRAEAVFSRDVEVQAATYEEAVEKVREAMQHDGFCENDNNGTQFFNV